MLAIKPAVMLIEFVDALDVYYHHLDDMLPAGRAIYRLQEDLIRAVDEMISTES